MEILRFIAVAILFIILVRGIRLFFNLSGSVMGLYWLFCFFDFIPVITLSYVLFDQEQIGPSIVAGILLIILSIIFPVSVALFLKIIKHFIKY